MQNVSPARNQINPEKLSLGIIIPAYQVRTEILEELIRRIRQSCRNYQMKIIIIDDGSDPPLLDQLQLPENILLYRHDKNLGKGMALQTGFRELLKSHSPDVIITIDSDLQHLPEYIPEFIHSFEKHGAHVVTGYRKRDLRIMPLSRIISNSLTSLIISLMTGQLIPDSQCGFRLIDATILPKMHFKEKRFHLESEFLIKSGWSGLTINSVKIPTIYHSEKSSINHLRDTLNFVWLVLRLLKERSGF